jgi:hypothetical protein
LHSFGAQDRATIYWGSLSPMAANFWALVSRR